MKRLRMVPALLLLLCALGSCMVPAGPGGASAQQPAAASDSPPGTGPALLLVGSRQSPLIAQAALLFAEKVSELSGGGVEVRVGSSSRPGEDFALQGAQFAFMDSVADASFCRYFPILSAPFLYNSYPHFTGSTNSEKLLDILSEEMLAVRGARPLASLYTGSIQLLTDWRASNYLSFEDVRLALDPASGSAPGFAALGSETEELPNPRDRLDLLLSGEAQGAEFSLDALRGADFEGEKLFLSMTCHKISPVWLIVQESYYGGLAERERAVVVEACAYLFSEVDSVVLAGEEEAAALLEEQDVSVRVEFGAVRRRILELQLEAWREEYPAEELHLLRLVADMAEYGH